jgi:hypothetical protein
MIVMAVEPEIDLNTVQSSEELTSQCTSRWHMFKTFLLKIFLIVS